MSKFSLDVAKWLAKTEIEAETFVRAVAFRLHDRIVMRTPVDTGRARASWTIVEGKTPDTTVAPEGFSGGAEAGASYALQRQAGVKRGTTYTIANSLPYIEALENGHSKQAPSGMVRLAIADIKTTLDVAFKG